MKNILIYCLVDYVINHIAFIHKLIYFIKKIIFTSYIKKLFFVSKNSVYNLKDTNYIKKIFLISYTLFFTSISFRLLISLQLA